MDSDAIEQPCTVCRKRPATPGLKSCTECRDRRPRRRRSRPRASTIPLKKLTRAALAIEAMSFLERAELESARPRTRGDCRDAPRPCPFVGCKHHLYLDVNPETGTIKLNFPDLEPWELAETCSLDVAERGESLLEDIGGIMNLTRERVRQVEVRGLMQLKHITRRNPGR